MVHKHELRFARRAVRKGIISGEQMIECIESLRTEDEKSLMDIIVLKEYASRQAVEEIQEEIATIQEPNSIVEKETVLGNYTIENKIGEGAMGTVYKAKNTKNQKIVAIKILDQELSEDAEFIARFLREAKNAAKLKNHPNIVEAYDLGEEDNKYYFVMEYVDGHSLAQILYSKGKISERLALMITKQVAQALDRAYQASIIHRDVKPENIMLSNEGIVKLCDLGLAKDLSEDMYRSTGGITLGTVYYSSPEQTSGNKDVDIRSDIYSLGISLYHMLTGELPFNDTDTSKVARSQINKELPSVAIKSPEISTATITLLQKMTFKNPDKRYQIPKELLDNLASIIHNDGEKIHLPKPKQSTTNTRTDIVLKKRQNKQVVHSSYYLWGAVVIMTILVIYLLSR